MISTAVRSGLTMVVLGGEVFLGGKLHSFITGFFKSPSSKYYSYVLRAFMCTLSFYPLWKLSKDSLLLRISACALQLFIAGVHLHKKPKKIVPSIGDYFTYIPWQNKDENKKGLIIKKVYDTASHLTPEICKRIPLISNTEHLRTILPYFPWIEYFSNLKTLTIISAAIKEFPISIFKLNKLEELELDCPNLSSLPENCFANLQLRILKIKGKDFKRLFDEQKLSSTLKSLGITMTEGGLNDLPNLFDLFPNLETLRIEHYDREEDPSLPDWLESKLRSCKVILQNKQHVTIQDKIF